MSTRFLLALAAFVAAPASWAQLAAPNYAGARLGHIHLAVQDVDAHKHFWIDMMGGKLVKKEPLELIQFPGVYIMLRKATEPTQPPEGSVVNHFGFVFADLPAMLALWKANGVKVEQSGNPNQGYVNAPDGIRVEFFGDPSLAVPVKMDHIHDQVADIPAIQAWYAKAFGGIPGTNLSFAETFPGAKAGVKPAGTKGRSLDHIGFDVANLDEFAKKLEGQGIKLDMPIRQIPNSKTKIAFLTDPWGTYIELTENLAP
jgi:catechol 2,3-dioxygenase-like lactoylglutathione lyase family enzyme